MDFLPGRREQREYFTPGAEADSGPGKDRKKKNHFLEKSLLIVLLRGSQELPRAGARPLLLRCLHLLNHRRGREPPTPWPRAGHIMGSGPTVPPDRRGDLGGLQTSYEPSLPP